jgi:hypothetical protein
MEKELFGAKFNKLMLALILTGSQSNCECQTCKIAKKLSQELTKSLITEE